MIVTLYRLPALAAALLLASPAIGGDYFCRTADASVKIQTYTLTETTGAGEEAWYSFAPQKAAAIFASAAIGDSAGVKMLLTGSVAQVPDRVGGKEEFSLIDAEGNPVHLRTVTTFLPVNCGRADCQWKETVQGALTINGTVHALQCDKTFF